jgi:hypothetical protein
VTLPDEARNAGLCDPTRRVYASAPRCSPPGSSRRPSTAAEYAQFPTKAGARGAFGWSPTMGFGCCPIFVSSCLLSGPRLRASGPAPGSPGTSPAARREPPPTGPPTTPTTAAPAAVASGAAGQGPGGGGRGYETAASGIGREKDFLPTIAPKNRNSCLIILAVDCSNDVRVGWDRLSAAALLGPSAMIPPAPAERLMSPPLPLRAVPAPPPSSRTISPGPAACGPDRRWRPAPPTGATHRWSRPTGPRALRPGCSTCRKRESPCRGRRRRPRRDWCGRKTTA